MLHPANTIPQGRGVAVVDQALVVPAAIGLSSASALATVDREHLIKASSRSEPALLANPAPATSRISRSRAVPSLASSFIVALERRTGLVVLGLRQVRPSTLRSLWLRHRCTAGVPAEHQAHRLAQCQRAVDHEQVAAASMVTPRPARSSSKRLDHFGVLGRAFAEAEHMFRPLSSNSRHRLRGNGRWDSIDPHGQEICWRNPRFARSSRRSLSPPRSCDLALETPTVPVIREGSLRRASGRDAGDEDFEATRAGQTELSPGVASAGSRLCCPPACG